MKYCNNLHKIKDSGVSCVLTISQFDIRLYAPTSTSKQVAVSINFADQNGMIITLNTNTSEGKLLPFFDCSWISRYPDEDERVFVNGAFPIRVTAILILKTNRNYTELLKSLYLFDCLLSGSFSRNLATVSTKDDARDMESLLISAGVMDAKEITTWTQEELLTYHELLAGGYEGEQAANAIYSSWKQNVSSDPYVLSMFTSYLRQKIT